MSNPFAGNVPLSPQQVNRFAKKPNINAANFSLTTGQSVVLDSDGYINNKVIQINTFSGTLTLTTSLDGVVFLPGPAIGAVGIYPIPVPCRYVKLQATGNCSGLVLGSL